MIDAEADDMPFSRRVLQRTAHPFVQHVARRHRLEQPDAESY